MLAETLVGVGDQEKVVIGHILKKNYILNTNMDTISIIKFWPSFPVWSPPWLYASLVKNKNKTLN